MQYFYSTSYISVASITTINKSICSLAMCFYKSGWSLVGNNPKMSIAVWKAVAHVKHYPQKKMKTKEKTNNNQDRVRRGHTPVR